MKNKKWFADNIGALIAIGFLVFAFYIFRMILLREVKATEPVQISIVECLKGLLFLIAGYYYGSSQGSKNKQETIEKAMFKPEEQKPDAEVV